GVVGRGFRFNGTGYISIPDNASLDLPNEITLELWYLDQPATNSTGSGFLCKRGVGVGPCNFGINRVPSGMGIYYNDPTVDYPANGSDDVQGIYESSRFRITTLGVFHHFVATYKQVGANQVRIDMYIDGVLVKTKSVLGNLRRSGN